MRISVCYIFLCVHVTMLYDICTCQQCWVKYKYKYSMKKYFRCKYRYQYLKALKMQIVLKKDLKYKMIKYYFIKTCDAKQRFFSKLFLCKSNYDNINYSLLSTQCLQSHTTFSLEPTIVCSNLFK